MAKNLSKLASRENIVKSRNEQVKTYGLIPRKTFFFKAQANKYKENSFLIGRPSEKPYRGPSKMMLGSGIMVMNLGHNTTLELDPRS